MNSVSALVLSRPTHNSTIRMRVWRALKDTGCGVLRDGVYVLPEDAAGAAVLRKMETDIQTAGGFAMTVDLKLKSAAQTAAVRELFDRSADYGALTQKIGTVSKTLPRLGHRKAQTAVRRLQRSFDKLSEIDFFPGQAKLQAAEAIVALKRSLQEAYSRGRRQGPGDDAARDQRKGAQRRRAARRGDAHLRPLLLGLRYCEP